MLKVIITDHKAELEISAFDRLIKMTDTFSKIVPHVSIQISNLFFLYNYRNNAFEGNKSEMIRNKILVKWPNTI